MTLVASQAHAQQLVPTATYELRLLGTDSPRIAVRATVPCDGTALSMATTRPGDVPEIADAGWPALVQHLKVTDSHGSAVGVTSAGATGWTLARSVAGPITLEYEVDYSPLAARGWPAPREAAFADVDHFVVLGRSLFIQTPAQHASQVRFVLPSGWQAVVPWPTGDGAPYTAAVASSDDQSEPGAVRHFRWLVVPFQVDVLCLVKYIVLSTTLASSEVRRTRTYPEARQWEETRKTGVGGAGAVGG